MKVIISESRFSILNSNSLLTDPSGGGCQSLEHSGDGFRYLVIREFSNGNKFMNILHQIEKSIR